MTAQKLNEGEVTTPRPAATVILVRGGADTLELLLVKRHPDQRFLGDHWVFPGGSVDPEDVEASADEDGAHRVAGVRELEEEAAVGGIDPGALVHFSRWITPRAVPIRFDTIFFLAPAPDGVEPRVDGSECVDWRWFTPQEALDALAAGEIQLILPTIKHLEQLGRFDSAEALFAEAREREVVPVEPRVAKEEGGPRIVLPGEPGYDELEEGG